MSDPTVASSPCAVPFGFRSDALDVPVLLQAFSQARWRVLQGGWMGLGEMREATSEADRRRLFIVAQKMSAPASVVTAQRSSGVASALRSADWCLDMSVSRVGRSSFELTHVLRPEGWQGEGEPPLVRLHATYVTVDPATGKAALIPEAQRGRMASAVVEKAPLETALTAPAPGSVEGGTWRVTVRPSDCDWNQHVNQSRWPVFALDALEVLNGSRLQACACAVEYKKEAKVGKELEVRVCVSDVEGGASQLDFEVTCGDDCCCTGRMQGTIVRV
eukprot:TRINITY_DN44167_c0_g1_i1.p1 TRINITY_DN44167_c0_g1~~TRINITY_DN44167_c0_g1_i1.p1  ORF type:complete len:293 (+),score=84.97 TRINITY_DN44167_c0_g1_i1:57-881(+)